MLRVIKQLLAILCLLLAVQSVFADTFVLKKIEVTGLQRVQKRTVLSYVPVQIGQPITTQDTVNILTVLYKTGFFSDVRLERQANTLIIHVVERPTIGLVIIKGNKEFKDKQLMPVLKDIGISEGEPYDQSKVNSIKRGLQQQYQQMGFYAVQISTRVESQPRNRVALYIEVKEGPVAKIKSLKIVGNKAFKEEILLKTFASKTSSWWRLTLLTGKDHYSKANLSKDLEELRKFYYNRGYLRFRIVDQKVVVSPDNKSVTIVIRIEEGPVYTIDGYEIQGLGPSYDEDKTTVAKYIQLKKGQVFSRQGMLNTSETLRLYFASKGHAFPIINTDPKLDDSKHEVFIIFSVTPGPVSYVSQINFIDNTRTNDEALRHFVLQMEGAPYSIVDVEQSKARLAALSYVGDVTVDTNPVPGKPDQVSLDYHIRETNAGKASIQGGYSTADGPIYGASLSEPNLLGTGKYGALNFSASEYQKSYSLSYVNPFYTSYGISRGVTVFSTITTPSTDLNLASYSMDGYGFAVNYGIPVSLRNRINLGFGYTYILLHDTDGVFNSPTVTDFVRDHPDPYNQVKGTVSWVYSTLNRALAPTRGVSQSIGLEVGVPVVRSSLSYYKITEELRYFHPVGYGFVLNPHASAGFGDGYGSVGPLPFFNNFYAGGLQTMPGYAANSLGPQNPNQVNAALGGNLRLLGGVNLILPTILTRQVRVALTFNVGNLWDTNKVADDQVSYESFGLSNFRMSAGAMIIWYSPMGPLELGIAEAFNTKSGDNLKLIDFAFGASI